MGDRIGRLGQAIGCLIGVLAAGCVQSSQDIERFVPDNAAARAAVEAALNEWQNGRSTGGARTSSPKVEFVDTHRRPGQSLERFEILGEAGSDAGRCFIVRLTMANPSEQERARFVVIGIDPIWVFREEDLTMLTHWDHAMPAAPTPEPKTEANR
jgi:hypothetical protein